MIKCSLYISTNIWMRLLHIHLSIFVWKSTNYSHNRQLRATVWFQSEYGKWSRAVTLAFIRARTHRFLFWHSGKPEDLPLRPPCSQLQLFPVFRSLSATVSLSLSLCIPARTVTHRTEQRAANAQLKREWGGGVWKRLIMCWLDSSAVASWRGRGLSHYKRRVQISFLVLSRRVDCRCYPN